MKYLGIDYGDERVGLAVCDSAETMAFALETLERKLLPTKALFFDALLKIIAEEAVEGVVIGLPLPLDPKEVHNHNAEEPLSCRKARNFAARLGRRIALPIYLVNEALSSAEAERRLQAAGFKRDKLKAKLDAEAAAVILQQFLNSPPEQRQIYEP